MSETDEIKEWQAPASSSIAFSLMIDHVSFIYNEENGIVFTAPDFYVENLKYRLVCSCGYKRYPKIKEFKPAE